MTIWSCIGIVIICQKGPDEYYELCGMQCTSPKSMQLRPQTKLILCLKPTMEPFLRISILIVQCLDHFIPDSSKHLVQMRPFMSGYYLALEALAFRKTIFQTSQAG